MVQIETPEDQPHKDESPAQPTDGSPDSASVPQDQPDDVDYSQAGDAEPDDDTAPDADDPGDDVVPEELEGAVQDAPDQPDEVDQPDENSAGTPEGS